MVIKTGENGITLDLALAYLNGGEIEYYEKETKSNKNMACKSKPKKK